MRECSCLKGSGFGNAAKEPLRDAPALNLREKVNAIRMAANEEQRG